MNKGESIRVFPLSNWTELDVWQYIHLEQIPIVPLYFAAPRPVVERDGVLLMVDDDRLPLRPGEVPQHRQVRFRTLGCYPLTGAIESRAVTLPEIIQEMLLTKTSERQGRRDRSGRGGVRHGREEEAGLLLARATRSAAGKPSRIMSHQSELIATDIDAYLKQHETKELLRLLTCGSVDDGKSTLIGRLLYDSKMIYEDQLAAIERDSKIHGTTGGAFDPALLTDGLKAEREQGITIDVAYRYFSTAKRKFIIADTPGHEQYTRNMATGASTADLAIILIDARRGVLTQTKRHSFITSLLGIKHVLVTVNKMDLVGYSQDVFESIRHDYTEFATRLDMPDLHFMPISALRGDNVVDPSPRMAWYQGNTLMHFLENVYIGSDRNFEDFRFPVQYVNRPHLDFRGFCGTVASGIVRAGDEVMALPSRQTSRVKSIVTFDGELQEAHVPLAITITLDDEIDISRGDMLVRPGNTPRLESRIEAMVVWMDGEPLEPGKPYLFKHTSKVVAGAVAALRYRVDVNTLHRQPSTELKLNEIGRCSITLSQPIAHDSYRRNRATGSFIVIDRITNRTVGAGMILDRTTGEDRLDHWEDEPAGTIVTHRSERYPAE